MYVVLVIFANIFYYFFCVLKSVTPYEQGCKEEIIRIKTRISANFTMKLDTQSRAEMFITLSYPRKDFVIPMGFTEIYIPQFWLLFTLFMLWSQINMFYLFKGKIVDIKLFKSFSFFIFIFKRANTKITDKRVKVKFIFGMLRF